MIKINGWPMFITVLTIGAVLTACGEDGLGSSSGAGSGDINVTGDENKICVINGDATDDNENLLLEGCGDYGYSPEEDIGTSQADEFPEG